MKTTDKTTAPHIETLLAAAHRDRDVLQERRGALLRSGIDSDHLPDELVLMAFALLGDHERDKLLEQVRAHWSELQSKGLAYGTIDDAATTELRLLARKLGAIALALVDRPRQHHAGTHRISSLQAPIKVVIGFEFRI